jgi:hypothetical protein
MGVFLGLSTWGNSIFEDDSITIRNIQYVHASKSIIEELEIKGTKKELINRSISVKDDLSKGEYEGLSYTSASSTIKQLNGIEVIDLSTYTMTALKNIKIDSAL